MPHVRYSLIVETFDEQTDREIIVKHESVDDGYCAQYIAVDTTYVAVYGATLVDTTKAVWITADQPFSVRIGGSGGYVHSMLAGGQFCLGDMSEQRFQIEVSAPAGATVYTYLLGDGVPLFVGSMFLMRPQAAATIAYNTTTQRYISLVPGTAAGATLDGATITAPRSFTIVGLWVLLNGANGATASATFAFNVGGVTDSNTLTVGPTATKAGRNDLSIDVAIDASLCLECTATANGPQQIAAIGIVFREALGTVIA